MTLLHLTHKPVFWLPAGALGGWALFVGIVAGISYLMERGL